jgi:hypothetical protein
MLSIALHPHSTGIYGDFLDALFSLKRAVKVRGERYAIISLLNRADRSSGEVSGILTTFTKVDTRSKWFDISNLKEASSEQTNKIVIPEGMYPNLKSFHFLFDLKRHLLYFQNYSEGDVLTPLSAYRIFKSLSEAEEVVSSFGHAKITIVQSKAALESLLKIPVIREIRVTILRPNPDVFADDFEAKIAAHLAETKARELEIRYRAEPGQSLEPDDDIERVSEYALNTGKVTVEGRDENGRVSRSTDQFPEVISSTFDPDEESDEQAFRRTVRQQQQR